MGMLEFGIVSFYHYYESEIHISMTPMLLLQVLADGCACNKVSPTSAGCIVPVADAGDFPATIEFLLKLEE